MLTYLIFFSYNSLTGDENQPQLPQHHLHSLAQIFVRYNVQSVFGLHLIHSHFPIPPETLMIGTAVNNGPIRCWTRPVPFTELRDSSLHGHIYALSKENHFVAYEFREGTAPPKVQTVQDAFFEEILGYLIAHKLTSILGLEVLEEGFELCDQTHEFVIEGQGTVMVLEEGLMYKNSFRVTGWSVVEGHDGIFCFKGNQSHSAPKSGGHQIFTDGKKLAGIRSVIELLCQEGIVGRF